MALERDLKDYLFENPEILFPDQVIASKRKEVCIEGRFIDLLFEVDGIQYIVELKRDTIRRETIGQIFEYYGLMRRSNKTANFRMILVAPSIPDFRRIPLEEFGIRCVEVPHPFDSQVKKEPVPRSIAQKRERDLLSSEPLAMPSHLNLANLLPPISRSSLKIAQALLRDGLPSVEKDFSEYEIRPVGMFNSSQPDVLCFPAEEATTEARFVRGGAWWAFSFGHLEQMPKNDVPNISVNALPWGLDFAINAELRSSQEVMVRKLASATSVFDRLVTGHGELRFQAWLKLEHQPRFYHWIYFAQKPKDSWKGEEILDLYRNTESEFKVLREKWIGWIKEQRKELTSGQIRHMERTNQNMNLALRLVRCFEKDDPVWKLPYQDQSAHFNEAYRKLKPLIEFFQ
jgi:hypothetical protein